MSAATLLPPPFTFPDAASSEPDPFPPEPMTRPDAPRSMHPYRISAEDHTEAEVLFWEQNFLTALQTGNATSPIVAALVADQALEARRKKFGRR